MERTKLLIDLKNVSKYYPVASGSFQALKNINLSIKRSQLVAITGKSGSGKSTLLNIISGIDKPSEGSIRIDDVQIDQLSESELASWRGKNIGIVFQFFQLIPTLTIMENVMLPMDFCNTYPKKERPERAMSLLEQVSIAEQADKLPSALSGGQQQRVAIARALANDPSIIIADEPTGNLDTHTATSIFELFTSLSDSGKTIITVTHETEFASWFEKKIAISDGEIVNELVNA